MTESNSVFTKIRPHTGMSPNHSNRPVYPWIRKLFGTKAARKGAVLRRSTAWRCREMGRDASEAELERRGFHLL